MLNYYYDLTNEDNLPVGARFVDPYDHEVYRIQPNETLLNFINQIKTSREDKKYPQILETELKQLVVASIYASSTKEQVSKYFVKRVAVANLSQIVSVSQTLASQLIHHNGAPSLQQREDRAQKCLNKCIFHKTNSTWSKSAIKLISKAAALVGLAELHQSESEKALGTCGMCGGCNLQEKVKFPVVAILAGLAPERLDLLIRAYKEKAFTKCWIMKEGLDNPVTRNLIRNKLRNGEANGTAYLDDYISNQVKSSRDNGKLKVVNNPIQKAKVK